MPVTGHAGEWALDPSVSARVFRNDNLQLLPSGGERVSGFSISPAVRGAVRSETREAGLELRATGNRYPGRSDLDTVDYRALFSGRLEQERNTFGLSATAVRDSTLQTERLATGQPLPRRQRTQLGTSPSYARALDETLMLKLESSLSSVRYEPGAGLIDFDTAGASASLQKALSERTSVALSASKSRYQADGINRSDTTGVSASLSHSALERLQLSLQLGVQSTATERRGTVPLQNVTIETRSRSRTQAYGAGATWQLERGLIGLSLGRDLNPTGSAALVRTDRASVSFTHRLDERVSLSLELLHLRSSFVDGPGTPASYSRLAPGVNWQVDPWLSLSAGFSYAEQRSGAPEVAAHSREVSLTAAYAWPRISRSR